MSCLSDLSSLIIHGANGVCGPPIGISTWAIVATLACMIACGTVSWLRPRSAPVVVGAAFVLFSLAGLRALAARADAPGAIAASTAAVTRLDAQIESFTAAQQRCVRVETSRCEVCEPIARKAIAPHGACATPAVVELGADSLEIGCRRDGERLLCGRTP